MTKEPAMPNGWFHSSQHMDDYEVGQDLHEKHSGSKCAYLKSTVQSPKGFGNFSQGLSAENYLGKRIRFSAFVKTALFSGTAQLWIRIDGDWARASTKVGCFDNMYDRPIKGETDWTRYNLVVEFPETSTNFVFGIMLLGAGQIWIDDVTIDVVSKDVPLTGRPDSRLTPINLNFED